MYILATFAILAAVSVFNLIIQFYDEKEVNRFKYAKKICEYEGYEYFLWFYMQSFFVKGVHIGEHKSYSPVVDAQFERLCKLVLAGKYKGYISHPHADIRFALSSIESRSMVAQAWFDPDTHLITTDVYLRPSTHFLMSKVAKKVQVEQAENSPAKEVEGY